MSRISIEKVTKFAKSEGMVLPFWAIKLIRVLFMIFCCGAYHSPLKTVFVSPNEIYRDRKLEVLVCPICGALVAELVQFNVKTQQYETFRPARKKVSKFIHEIQSGKWEEIKVKYGTRERAGFVFGINKEFKNGKIYQYAVNFNGEKKLVKVIN